MFEIFRFYMPSLGAKPSFGANSAAANVWTMFVFAVGALAGLVVAVTGRLFSSSAVVLGAASIAFFLLARSSLPKARRAYEIDKIIRRQQQGRRM